MPSVDLAALPSAVVRPLVVAIAHLPILFIACCATPLWLVGFLRPALHNELAFRLLAELRSWSCDVVRAASGVRSR